MVFWHYGTATSKADSHPGIASTWHVKLRHFGCYVELATLVKSYVKFMQFTPNTLRCSISEQYKNGHIGLTTLT